MFQWYVIRHLKVTYIPSVGSSTAGALALGYATDWDLQTALATPTSTQVLELNPAFLTPVWQQAALEMKNTGTKLYECYLSSESGENRFQGLLAARGVGSTTSTSYGQLFLEYVIDFYQPTPLLSSVDRDARRARHAAALNTTHDSLFAVGPARLVRSSRAESKEEKPMIETDDLDPSPPHARHGDQYSIVPGTAGYLVIPPPPTPPSVPAPAPLKVLSRK
jgi:hypothetical protein